MPCLAIYMDWNKAERVGLRSGTLITRDERRQWSCAHSAQFEQQRCAVCSAVAAAASSAARVGRDRPFVRCRFNTTAPRMRRRTSYLSFRAALARQLLVVWRLNTVEYSKHPRGVQGNAFDIRACSGANIWLILPELMCLFQRLSHACLCINDSIVKPRTAH